MRLILSSYWMEILTDFICFEQTSFDIAYITEIDPLWQDDSLTTILNPEAVLFSKPSSAEEIAATLSIWFRCDIIGADLRDMLVGMVSRGFLANHARGFVRATSHGRRHARPHLYGVVQMLDSGTKMLDAAVMLSLVGIAAHELDGEIDNETIVD